MVEGDGASQASAPHSAKQRITSGSTQGISVEGARAPVQRINPSTGRQNRHLKRPPPQVRKVNDFIIFLDEVLGEGQYGKVCKAQLASDLLQDVQGVKK